MTVLAAMHDPERRVTWIGSDTFATMGSIKFTCSPKWVVGPYWAVGCAGDGRLQTLVEWKLAKALDRDNTPHSIAEKIREAVKEDDWNTDSDPGAPHYGVWLMLASPEGVWTICTAFSVDRMQSYWADGSGGQVALGAMHASQGKKPQEIVTAGIEAAIEHERQCGGRAWVHSLEREIRVAAE